jgi:hypothetical protein
MWCCEGFQIFKKTPNFAQTFEKLLGRRGGLQHFSADPLSSSSSLSSAALDFFLVLKS